MLVHVAASRPQVGSKLASSWPQVGASWPRLDPVGTGWPKLVPKRLQEGPKLAHVGSRWPQKQLHYGPFPKASPRLAKASTKALPLRFRCSKMSTKALPRALRRLIVPSGSSILLLWILKVVPYWCFFQFALSWQVLQNDLFKRSSQVVPVSGSFLKLHLFSCIARRHSSTYIHTSVR